VGEFRMKIKTIQVVFTWEDGTVNEVSSYLPSQTWEALELFSDYWEEKYNDDVDVDHVEECGK
jgi:hypothetical protein